MVVKTSAINLLDNDRGRLSIYNKINEVIDDSGTSYENDKGPQDTEAALIAAYPTAEEGDFAIVAETDTIWVWDETTEAWVNTAQTDSTVIKTLLITLLSTVESGSTFGVVASESQTVSGTVNSLGVNASTFNASQKIQLFLNGINLVKGVDVVWVSTTTFILNVTVDADDIITINS